MKQRYFLTTFILSFLFIGFLSAQNVNIPDANFKAALVGNPLINTSGDSEIQLSEATAYTGTINVNSMGISNMTGIEAFTNVTRLYCGFNSLTTLDLSYNVSLTYVNCVSNSLTTLDVAECTNLDTLYCQINNLTCLDLHNNTNLNAVNCNSNNLTALNLKNGNNTGLAYVNSTSNGFLYCIQVDNVAYALTAGWFYDTWSTYNTSCNQPTAGFFTSAGASPVCLGTPITFTELCTAETYLTWFFGDGNTSNASTTLHTYADAGSYMVTIVAGNCNGVDTAYGIIDVGTDIYGIANKPSGTVDEGFAVLYPYEYFYTAFDTLEISPLGPGGSFHFTNIPDGDYLIQVFPDTTTYPFLIPSYYTNDWAWDSAAIFTHGCTSHSFMNMEVIELPSTTPGPGLIQGYVIEGPGFGRAQGDPIHGVVVKRGITSSSQIVESTETDLAGQFFFANVDYGTYTIYADIPGLERDSCYEVTIDALNNQHINLYYLVDSTSIYIVPGIGIEDIADNENSDMRIFPNPVKNFAVIDYAINVNAEVNIDIIDMNGTKLHNLLSQEMDMGEYNLPFNTNELGLKPGFYLVRLTANGRSNTQRIIVTN